ncbi:uncharacterized protein PFLUO_LOCUS1942 [Penicillium psychrofluorescens]|uniref:uncharacterized protein n=1 Tax=Penicillium psychrofluorescens TaxID=3158075 RepID=UPI003CCCF1AF
MQIVQSHPIIKYYLDRVAPNCLEQWVDNLWTRILRRYFYLDKYGIEREARVAENSLIRANVIVSKEHSGQFCQFLFVESKRAPPANRMPSERWCDRAATQLSNYMAASREHLKTPSEAPKLFGIVSIGRYVRFYSMVQESNCLIPIDNITYDLKKDSNEIEDFLTEFEKCKL